MSESVLQVFQFLKFISYLISTILKLKAKKYNWIYYFFFFFATFLLKSTDKNTFKFVTHKGNIFIIFTYRVPSLIVQWLILRLLEFLRIFPYKITDWLNCDKNVICYEELMDNEIIKNILKSEKPGADECDKSRNDYSGVSHIL